nr:IST1-like protein [Tanacetum cinerariifolium]
MSKPRECPDECNEAVSTLMFAAARFADLPELRELRTLFVKRYGNSIEPYVNPEFVNNLKADPPAKAIKLQMMQEITTQYSITWNSKSLETKLYTPPVVKDWSQYGNGTKNESPKPRPQNVNEGKIQETEKKHYIKQIEDTKKDDTLAKELPYKQRAETEKKEDNRKDLNVRNGLPYTPRAEVETKKNDLTKKVTAWNEKVAAASIPNEREEGSENISKPVPRSMRNRRPFQPVGGSSRSNNEIPKPSPKRLHGENLDRGVDEEEMKMDKLLSHYCRKLTHTPYVPTHSGSLPAESVATPVPKTEEKG